MARPRRVRWHDVWATPLMQRKRVLDLAHTVKVRPRLRWRWRRLRRSAGGGRLCHLDRQPSYARRRRRGGRLPPRCGSGRAAPAANSGIHSSAATPAVSLACGARPYSSRQLRAGDRRHRAALGCQGASTRQRAVSATLPLFFFIFFSFFCLSCCLAARLPVRVVPATPHRQSAGTHRRRNQLGEPPPTRPAVVYG